MSRYSKITYEGSFAPSEGRRFGSNSGGFEREKKVGFGSSGGADLVSVSEQ